MPICGSGEFQRFVERESGNVWLDSNEFVKSTSNCSLPNVCVTDVNNINTTKFYVLFLNFISRAYAALH